MAEKSHIMGIDCVLYNTATHIIYRRVEHMLNLTSCRYKDRDMLVLMRDHLEERLILSLHTSCSEDRHMIPLHTGDLENSHMLDLNTLLRG